MFGGTNLRRKYASVIKQIEGERHVPRHDRPESIHGRRSFSRVTPAHEVVFEDFEWFGTQMNHLTSHAWAVEETPETLIDDPPDEPPDLGRTYKVFYGAAQLGRLQITAVHQSHFTNPSGSRLERKERFRKERSARALVELEYLNCPYPDASNFIAAVERLLGRSDEAASARAMSAAVAALTGYLWEAICVDDVAGTFYHRTEGPYEWLREETDHWRAVGIDPFERWNGDRRGPDETLTGDADS